MTNINNYAATRTEFFNISEHESSDDGHEDDEDFNPEILNLLQHKHQSLRQSCGFACERIKPEEHDK